MILYYEKGQIMEEKEITAINIIFSVRCEICRLMLETQREPNSVVLSSDLFEIILNDISNTVYISSTSNLEEPLMFMGMCVTVDYNRTNYISIGYITPIRKPG